MRAERLATTMVQLGWITLVGMGFQIRIDDRSVLFPFFATAVLVVFLRLARYDAWSGSPWYRVALAAGAVTASVGFLSLVPGIQPGGPSAIATAAATLGIAAYAGVLRDWSTAQGWAPPVAKARAAQVWLGAALGVMAGGLLALLVLVDPATASADGPTSPSAAFGRPLDGWAPGLVVLACSVLSLVGMLRLHQASRLIRHSLRAQPDAVLVGA